MVKGKYANKLSQSMKEYNRTKQYRDELFVWDSH